YDAVFLTVSHALTLEIIRLAKSPSCGWIPPERRSGWLDQYSFESRHARLHRYGPLPSSDLSYRAVQPRLPARRYLRRSTPQQTVYSLPRQSRVPQSVPRRWFLPTGLARRSCHRRKPVDLWCVL